jgi:hypothetical protein
MPNEDKNTQPQPVEITDLPPKNTVDGSKVADQVKGGADVVSPRDPATGLPTGKRL